MEEKPKIDLSVFKKRNIPKENSIAAIIDQNAVPAEDAKSKVEQEPENDKANKVISSLRPEPVVVLKESTTVDVEQVNLKAIP